MDKRYWWATGLFAIAIATLAGLWTLLLPRIDPAPLAVAAAAAYGAALLLDVLPPGQPRDTDGTPLQPATRLAAASALGGIAAMVTVTLAVTAIGPGDESTSARLAFDAHADTSPTPAGEATSRQTPHIVVAETPTPITPTPTPTPTSEPVPPTPTIPDSAFANCTRVEGSIYTCGDQPWRVICAPGGYFFDPDGTVPDPIPREWRGWSETTLTERLEYIHNACPGDADDDD